MEYFKLLLKHLAWIEPQFLSGLRDSRETGSLWGMMKGVGGVRKSIHQSWYAKRVRVTMLEGLKVFRKRLRRKRPTLLKSAQWHFQQDNTPVHNSILVTDGTKTVPQPPYSRDLAPCDFWLFPKLIGCRYGTIEEMKVAVTKVIDTLTQEEFHGAMERDNKCIAAGGDYFEGDYSFMCVLSIKVPIRKQSWKSFNDPRCFHSIFFFSFPLFHGQYISVFFFLWFTLVFFLSLFIFLFLFRFQGFSYCFFFSCSLSFNIFLSFSFYLSTAFPFLSFLISFYLFIFLCLSFLCVSFFVFFLFSITSVYFFFLYLLLSLQLTLSIFLFLILSFFFPRSSARQREMKNIDK